MSGALPIREQLQIAESILDNLRKSCKKHGYEKTGYYAFKAQQRIMLLQVNMTDEESQEIDKDPAES